MPSCPVTHRENSYHLRVQQLRSICFGMVGHTFFSGVMQLLRVVGELSDVRRGRCGDVGGGTAILPTFAAITFPRRIAVKSTSVLAQQLVLRSSDRSTTHFNEFF